MTDVFETEPPCPGANRHETRTGLVETAKRPDGTWLFRCPRIYPVNARHWHGPYADEATALADHARRTTPPRLTREEVEDAKRHGYHGVVNGVPTVVWLCPLTGGTHITTYELVDG